MFMCACAHQPQPGMMRVHEMCVCSRYLPSTRDGFQTSRPPRPQPPQPSPAPSPLTLCCPTLANTSRCARSKVLKATQNSGSRWSS